LIGVEDREETTFSGDDKQEPDLNWKMQLSLWMENINNSYRKTM
jgi:hypothetical protein